MNKVILVGNMVADPEFQTTASGVSLCKFRIAVQRKYKNEEGEYESDFISVVAWRNTAEFIAKYFHKGSAICITGSIQNRTWIDQQGQKRYSTDIVADEANFVESRNTQEGVPSSAGDIYAAPAYSTPTQAAPKFEEIKTDDDLPF